MKKNNPIEKISNNRIIVIDDDPDVWEAYKAILAPQQLEGKFTAQKKMEELVADAGLAGLSDQKNFDVSFASQGQEGLQIVEKSLQEDRPFAIAFIDVRMPPGWDGMETAVQIRAIDPDIEIVIVTAYADRSRDEIAKAVNPPHKLLYLRKPFDLDELKQIALSLCEKWKIFRIEERQRKELSTILTTTPAAIFTTDMQRRITSWNPAAEKVTGYSAEEVVGNPCIFKDIANESLCRKCSPGSVAAQSDHNTELTFLDKGGKQRTISLNASPLKDRDNKIIGMVESFWDITLRKEFEEALHESEESFRSLVETTSDWVWQVDSESRFTYCSPVCEDLYGYMPEELLGQSLFDTLVAPDSVEEFKKQFQQNLGTSSGFQGVERQVITKDGKTIFVESSATPITDDEAKIAGYHGIDRDISDRKKMEAEKSMMEEHYHQGQKLEALGTLAGGIAHDFNNILTPIIGYAQLGELHLKKDQHDKIQECFDIIIESASSAADLTKQILAYSRQQVLDTRRVNVSLVVENMGKMLNRLIREDIELEYDLARDLWFTKADTGRLGQVLINLIVNSKDAIKGSGRIAITTRNESIPESGPLLDAEKNFFSGDFVLMAVSDTGAGIDEKNQERIFDPFFTTKPTGQGTGIGLSTVFGIVKQHAGHIILKSQPGQGTTIMICLPKEGEYKPRDEKKKMAVDLQQGNETILLVEDSKEVLDAISTGLKIFGYKVIEASGSEKAIRMIHELDEKIDMLITDVVMPGLSGKAVAETFRIKFDNLPVLFISGHTSEIAPHDLHDLQRTSFMQKPFSPSQLAARVRAILDGTEDADASPEAYLE
jgi:two-component system cell cycle sensor histidine kinase/response regulator CckA